MPFMILLASWWYKLLFLLDYWDKRVFLQINVGWTNSLLNKVFPVWREASTWLPFYIFLIALVLVNFGKKSWTWILALMVTIALSDQISSGLLKNWVGRVRPCNDIFIQMFGRLLLNRCPSSGSFTSSHATNHFALSMFIIYTLRPYVSKWAKYLLLAWAASIAYGQVYVGVHYPLDVLAGTLLGCGIGAICGKLYNAKIGLPALQNS